MNNLQEIRKKAGLSQSQLAEKTGISVRTIQAWEKFYRDLSKASLENLLKLAEALNCEIDDLIIKN